MNMNNLLHRLYMVRNAEFSPHHQRMCVLGYLGAMLEVDKIEWDEYLRLAFLADNACKYREMDLQNAL